MSYKLIKKYATQFKRYGTPREGEFDSIQIHSIGCAQNTATTVYNNMNVYSPANGIVHALVDSDSNTSRDVIQLLPNNNVAWADSGYGNRHSFTIEIMESDYMQYKSNSSSYTITNSDKFKADVKKGYEVAVEYVADLCKEFGFNPTDKLSNGLHRVYSHDEGRILGLSTSHVDPTHLWSKLGYSMDGFRQDVKKAMNGNFNGSTTTTTASYTKEVYYRVRKSWSDEKSQLGAYTVLDNAKKNCPVGYSVFDESGKAIYSNTQTTSTAAPYGKTGTQSTDLAKLSDTEAANKLLEITRPIALKYGLFPSVIAAQACLESGYGHTTKLSEYNNICGMKCDLVNSAWSGSTWDGKSKVLINTPEVINGKTIYKDDYFRVYENLEQCLSDICAFLTSMKKYIDAGIKNAKDYREQITIESKNGYATDPSYISKVCQLIEKYNLNRYDSEKFTKPTTPTTTQTTQQTSTVKGCPAVVELVKSRLGKNEYSQDQTLRQKVFEGWSDCSSLMWKAYEKAYGVQIGSWTGEQVNHGKQIIKRNSNIAGAKITQEELNQLLPGDLCFFGDDNATHVEMFVGNGSFIGHGSKGVYEKNALTYSTGDSSGFYQARRYYDESTKKAFEFSNLNSPTVTTTTQTESVKTEQSTTVDKYYRVGTGWSNGKCQNQMGAYTVLDNAKSKCEMLGSDYSIYDWNGKKVYPEESNGKYADKQSDKFKGTWTVNTNGSSLNLRNIAGSSDSSTILTTMSNGSKCTSYGGYYCSINGVNWQYVSYNGISGFACQTYLKK